MINLFGKSRIRELEADLQLAIEAKGRDMRENQALRNQVEYLIRTIRKTDDIIFSISQCPDYELMRPRIAQLVDEMTSRKVAESNRINDLVTGELIKTYANQTNVPQIGKHNG